MPLWIETPLIESVPMGLSIGKKVRLKLENVQPAGSFKLRGIGALCEYEAARGAKGFTCATTGSAGYALAWAGRELGLPAVICAPDTMPKESIRPIRLAGQTVEPAGHTWYDADERATALAAERGYTHISTNEHPVLWHGISTIVDELAAQGEKPDTILCSVGSGGLISGLCEGLLRNGWGDVRLIGCGTYGANAYSLAIEAGKVVTIENTTSIIPCISALHVINHVMDFKDSVSLQSFLTTDIGAVTACERFLDDHRLLVDPSCGVALAPLYENAPVLRDSQNIIVIVCGGVGITVEKLGRMKALAVKQEELA
jgi:L-serine/L-threonine ammonia-lyase